MIEDLNIVAVQESFSDYPEYLSLIFYVRDCNWDCIDCQNKCNLYDLDSMSLEEVLGYVESSKSLINHFVISGGEPTLYPHDALFNFISEIKLIVPSAKIKLDTNGTNPYFFVLAKSFRNIDAVSMDIKASLRDRAEYSRICGRNIYLSPIISSVKHLKEWSEMGKSIEFRTTLVDDQIKIDDIYDSLKEVVGGELGNISYTVNTNIIRKI